MSTSYHKRVIAGFILAIAFIAGFWQPDAVAAERARFKITVTAASKKGSGIDAKLKHLRKNLSQLSQYSKFRYVSSTSFELAVNGRRSFSIGSGIKGTISLKSVKNRRAAFNFKLSSRSKNVDINYSIPPGGATMVVGPSVGSETYVIVIRAVK